MSYTADVTDDAVFTQLRAFILDALGTGVTEVVRIPRNRTPMPKHYPFITMSPVLREEIMRPVIGGLSAPETQPQTQGLTAAVRFQIQLDAYGPTSGDAIQTLHTLLNSPYAFDFFAAQTPAGVYPLYAAAPSEAAIIDEEAESVVRWMMDISLQFNPTLTSTIQTASTAVVGVINVEAAYH